MKIRHLSSHNALILRSALIFICQFIGKAQSTEHTPLCRVFPRGTKLTADSDEAMQIKCHDH